MKKILLICLLLFSFNINVFADSEDGRYIYMKHLRTCAKNKIINGAHFAQTHTSEEWSNLKRKNTLVKRWIEICPVEETYFNEMKEEDVNNLFLFLKEYASDGEVPTC